MYLYVHYNITLQHYVSMYIYRVTIMNRILVFQMNIYCLIFNLSLPGFGFSSQIKKEMEIDRMSVEIFLSVFSIQVVRANIM